MGIIVALLAIIASCLLFGPHATLVMIVIFGLVALFMMAIWRVREWAADAPYRRACRQAERERRKAERGRRKAQGLVLSKKDRLTVWIAALAIPGIFVLTWLGSGR